MKVSELIEVLQSYDPDASILVPSGRPYDVFTDVEYLWDDKTPGHNHVALFPTHK